MTRDVNDIEWHEEGWTPDIIVNTSTEHFANDRWFHTISPLVCVVVQGNNQPHDHFTNKVNSLDELRARYPLSKELYADKMDFTYPDKQYTRFMLMGHR